MGGARSRSRAFLATNGEINHDATHQGVIDPRPPDNTRNLAPLEEKTDGPEGTNAWLLEFDNDTNEALPVQLRVLCTFSKLNTKRA